MGFKAFLEVITIAVLVRATYSCTMNQIEECSRLIKTGRVSSDRAFQSVGEPEFSALCREVEEYNRCIGGFYHSCPDPLVSAVNGIRDALQYMCKDGKQVYLKHHQCFGKDDLNTDAMKCVKTYKATLGSVKSRVTSFGFSTQQDKDEALDDICKATDDYKECAHREVNKFCGEEAAKFQDEMLKRTADPGEALGGCSPTSFRHLKPIIFVSIGIVGFILIAVVCVIRRTTHNRREAAEVESFNNPLENAYGENPPKYEV